MDHPLLLWCLLLSHRIRTCIVSDSKYNRKKLYQGIRLNLYNVMIDNEFSQDNGYEESSRREKQMKRAMLVEKIARMMTRKQLKEVMMNKVTELITNKSEVGQLRKEVDSYKAKNLIRDINLLFSSIKCLQLFLTKTFFHFRTFRIFQHM